MLDNPVPLDRTQYIELAVLCSDNGIEGYISSMVITNPHTKITMPNAESLMHTAFRTRSGIILQEVAFSGAVVKQMRFERDSMSLPDLIMQTNKWIQQAKWPDSDSNHYKTEII